jgi:hypothetical protein
LPILLGRSRSFSSLDARWMKQWSESYSVSPAAPLIVPGSAGNPVLRQKTLLTLQRKTGGREMIGGLANQRKTSVTVLAVQNRIYSCHSAADKTSV